MINPVWYEVGIKRVCRVLTQSIIYLVHCFIASTLDTQVDGRIGQGATHVKLQRQVIDALQCTEQKVGQDKLFITLASFITMT